MNGPNGSSYCQKALHESLRHLSRELGYHSDKPFFMGHHPGRVDILLEWPMSLVYQRGWVNLEKKYPNLYYWLKTVYSRQAWRRAIDLGNGYDLGALPDYRRDAIMAEAKRAQESGAEDPSVKASSSRPDTLRRGSISVLSTAGSVSTAYRTPPMSRDTSSQGPTPPRPELGRRRSENPSGNTPPAL